MEFEDGIFAQAFALRAERFKRINKTILEDDHKKLVAEIMATLDPLNPPQLRDRLFKPNNAQSSHQLIPGILLSQDALK